MKYVKKVFMVVCALSVMITLSANPVQRVSQALENTKNVSVEAPFIGNALNTISSAHAYEASLGFNIPEIYWDIGVRKYVLKDEGVLTFFSTEHEMFTSNEFLASIHNDF
ncbi:MAG: hypothetical protein EOM67_15420 [Spirochaetia bacterium]|nr:hypothetical protein [Spirochaetia bacterium]